MLQEVRKESGFASGFFFVSELADKEQTENKNWNYILPFCLIELKDLCTNQIYCRY